MMRARAIRDPRARDDGDILQRYAEGAAQARRVRAARK